MRRGDVYLVDFEPSQGAEADKERLAVIVSNEGTNQGVEQNQWGVVNVVPLSSNVTHIHKFQVMVPAVEAGLDFDSRAQAEQVRAVSFGRLLEHIGHVPPPLMRQIDAALRTQLVL